MPRRRGQRSSGDTAVPRAATDLRPAPRRHQMDGARRRESRPRVSAPPDSTASKATAIAPIVPRLDYLPITLAERQGVARLGLARAVLNPRPGGSTLAASVHAAAAGAFSAPPVPSSVLRRPVR
jgi:hypothetical protein